MNQKLRYQTTRFQSTHFSELGIQELACHHRGFKLGNPELAQFFGVFLSAVYEFRKHLAGSMKSIL